MEENNTNVENTEVQAQAEEPLLPSEMEPEITLDDFLKDNTSENGKLYGRFDNPIEALKFFREQEVKHTNTMREIKEGQKEAEQIGSEMEAVKEKMSKLSELSMEVAKMDMNISDEIKAQMQELDISEQEIKLGAYEARDTINRIYGYAGGEEAYTSLMDWGSTQYDETQTAKISEAIRNNLVPDEIKELAILGLKYKQGGNQPNQQEETYQRIEGTHKNTSDNGGYRSFEELIKDRKESQKNPALRAKYQSKLMKTDEAILKRFG